MKAYTDMPIIGLGDTGGQEAPIREVQVISYDGGLYCTIEVEGLTEEVKRGYVYLTKGRCGDVPCVSEKELEQLKGKKNGTPK